MAVPGQEYHSLVIRKAQLLASEHGGLSKIPKELQKKLGFDIIAGRKGHSISVRIPEGDLSSRIEALRGELPAVTFHSAKPDPEKIFGKYVPRVSEENQTMEDFWIMQGWYKQDKLGIKLIQANWKDDPNVRTEAVKFLVEKVLKKDPRDITKEDFYSNRLSGLLMNYYSNSPYEALLEAGYACSAQESLQHAATGNFQTDKFYPWEMSSAPNQFYQSGQNRIAAVKWLLWKTQKNPKDIFAEDFRSNCLGGLLVKQYEGSPHAALSEAGYQFNPWELCKAPQRFYKSPQNRMAAVNWLVEKLQKDPRDITFDDFHSNRLGGLLYNYYNNRSYEALLEAGLVTPTDEAYMKRSGVNRFSEI